MVESKVRDTPSPTKTLALPEGSGDQEAGPSLQGREGLHSDHKMTPDCPVDLTVVFVLKVFLFSGGLPP